jgi:putative ABC transport system permease protein
VSGPLYLAWRYLIFHRMKAAILLLSITLIAFLPAGLNVLVGESAEQLRARAEATPLLLGAKGSPLELALSSLYFESRTPEPVPFGEVDRVLASGLADAIPLHVGFRVGTHAIVGTEVAYFSFRSLDVVRGRPMASLGECVLGAEAASSLGVGPGDAVVSSPESVFDLAGVYPLRMRVAGVLAASGGPDDRAVFVDVKTAWVIAGLGHGHADLREAGSTSSVMRRETGAEGERIVANASVQEYNEISAENIASFHFHGDMSSYPITAVLAIPSDDRSRALLMGRYSAPDETLQVLRPVGVIDGLLGTVFTVRGYVVAALGLVGVATLATAALVFALSIQLRRREIETLVKIGGSRGSVAVVILAEVVFVLLCSGVLAAALTFATEQFGGAAIRRLLLL